MRKRRFFAIVGFGLLAIATLSAVGHYFILAAQGSGDMACHKGPLSFGCIAPLGVVLTAAIGAIVVAIGWIVGKYGRNQ